MNNWDPVDPFKKVKPEPIEPPKLSFTQKFSERFLRWEVYGHKTANKMHKYFVNAVLLFMAYNIYTFIGAYNSYWRLWRDSDLPKDWQEEAPRAGHLDWKVEWERIERENRAKG